MTKRLLLSLAHPDDESFGLGGAVARYADQGVEVHLICSTNGDVGIIDPEFMKGYATIAERRLAELQCAADTLGLAGVYTFGYRDSGMAGTEDNNHPDSLVCATDEELTRRIVEVIREVKPQVVATFDPYGGYGHPDHIKMHHTTTAAFHKAADAAYLPESGPLHQAEKLYYHTFPRGRLKFQIALLSLFGKDPEHFGRNGDINLKEIANHEYPVHARVNFGDYQDIAEQARNCHASQLSGFSGGSLLRRIADLLTRPINHFMRVYPPVESNVSERDLFEGVNA